MAIVEVAPVTYIPLDFIELRHKRRDSALTQLAAAARRHGVVRDVDALIALLVRRERLGTTALGKGVALTHARSISIVRGPSGSLDVRPRASSGPPRTTNPSQIAVLYLSHPSRAPRHT